MENNNVMNIIEGDSKPEPINVNTFTIGTASPLNSGAIATSSTTTASWPYYYQTYPYYNYVKTPWISIEKAENGFIVTKNGLTFVCKNVKEVTSILSKKD